MSLVIGVGADGDGWGWVGVMGRLGDLSIALLIVSIFSQRVFRMFLDSVLSIVSSCRRVDSSFLVASKVSDRSRSWVLSIWVGIFSGELGRLVGGGKKTGLDTFAGEVSCDFSIWVSRTWPGDF